MFYCAAFIRQKWAKCILHYKGIEAKKEGMQFFFTQMSMFLAQLFPSLRIEQIKSYMKLHSWQLHTPDLIAQECQYNFRLDPSNKGICLVKKSTYYQSLGASFFTLGRLTKKVEGCSSIWYLAASWRHQNDVCFIFLKGLWTKQIDTGQKRVPSATPSCIISVWYWGMPWANMASEINFLDIIRELFPPRSCLFTRHNLSPKRLFQQQVGNFTVGVARQK